MAVGVKMWVLVVCAGLGFMAGCTTASKARSEAQKSFLQGQQQAIAAQQQLQAGQQASVWFRGLVRNNRVPWAENLTLSRALAAAQYTGALDPAGILVIRQGQAHRIDPRRLLRGEDDPVLEPDDIIELQR